MISRVLRQIDFAIPVRTLRSVGVTLDQVAVVDSVGEPIWMEHDDPARRQQMNETWSFLWQENNTAVDAGGVRRCARPNGGLAVAARVDDETEAHLFDIVVLTAPDVSVAASEVARLQDAIVAVAAGLRNEFELNKELESMAGELADRYEELNLVFQSDSSSLGMFYGQESLRRVVRDTVDFLDVGMAALVLPAKDLEIYYQHEDSPVSNLPHLLFKVRRYLFDRICEDGETLVVNTPQDSERFGLPMDVSYGLVVAPIEGGNGTVIGMLVVSTRVGGHDFRNSDRNLIDVMARKITKILQANFDALTGLENGYSFEWIVGQALHQAHSHGQRHAIIQVDIDRTNVINDISGRAAGDELVRQVANVLNGAVRAHDSVARIGGDKFGILLENCSLDDANRLAQRISRQVEELDFTWEGVRHSLSVSIGVAPVTSESENVAAALSSAEVARTAAKERGRNRIQVYEQNDIDLLRRRGEFQWVERIQRALREERFVLHGQKIHPLKATGDKPHFEVLVRMTGEDGELIPPGKFLPAAEHFHLMPMIDKWVVCETVRVLRQIADDVGAVPMMLSINLSGQSLSDERLQSLVITELRRLGKLAQHLCFEITESAAVTNLQEALQFIADVRRHGCRFSLDDFGSGLSSFAYLQRFKVDYLKIDGSFVRRIDTDPIAASMVSAINQVGQVMGLQTIAEFVENAAIVDELKRIGVDYAQGYHFARPMPLDGLMQDCVRTLKTASG